MVAVTHASNVCGTILPVEEIGELCARRGLLFILDAAQTAGILEIDFQKIQAHALAFTGHKGLLAPQGIGGFVIDSELAEQMEPLISGGTEVFPSRRGSPLPPGQIRSGDLESPWNLRLHAALNYLENTGLEAIRAKEQALARILMEGFTNMEGVVLVGPASLEDRVAVISVDFPDRDNGEVTYKLEKFYGIQTRCGLHCAPAAHKTLGTFPRGTVRFSPGWFNTKGEMQAVLAAVQEILADS